MEIKEYMTSYYNALIAIEQEIREKKLTEDKKSFPLIF
jgi:hypothetical protein